MKMMFVMIGLGALAATPTAASDPTCSDAGIGVEVHGQHVVRDYVAGDGLASEWPPQSMHEMADNRGAAVPGGPGPGFHFEWGVKPGASFCTDSQSWHIYGDDE